MDVVEKGRSTSLVGQILRVDSHQPLHEKRDMTAGLEARRLARKRQTPPLEVATFARFVQFLRHALLGVSRTAS
jgi:hypothetical protein